MIRKLGSKLHEFFFRPASPVPLAALRIALSACLLLQAAMISRLIFELYGSQGIMQGALNDYFGPGIPNVSALLRLLSQFNLGERAGLFVLSGAYLSSLLALILGWHTRIAAVAAWFLHLVLTQGHTTAYGVDTFSHIFLFYLIWIPCGHALSLDARAGRVSAEPSDMARLGLRVLQIHLAVAYCASGIDKSVGAQWWNGEAIWRSVMLPVYVQFDLSWLSHYPWLMKIFGWGTLLVEGAYPLFIFPRLTRKLWLALTVSMHVGIALFLGLHLFGLVMIVFNVCFFGISAEPGAQPLFAWRRRSTSALTARLPGDLRASSPTNASA